YDPASGAVEDQIIKAFEAEHPDIEVQKIPINTGAGKVWEKAAVMAAGGDAPDVVDVSLAVGLSARRSGLLLDLQPFIQADNFDMSRFRPGWQLTTGPDSAWGGKVYGIPWGLGILNIFYNRDMFRAAGLAEPYKGWTTSEFLNAAKHLTRAGADGKIQVFGTHPPNVGYSPWMFVDGNSLVDEQTGKLDLKDPKFAASLEFIRDVNANYNVSSWGDFRGQQVAMDYEWDSFVGKLLTGGTSFDWSVTWAPRGPDAAEPVSYGQGHVMGIMKDSKNPQAAWQFVKFYYSDAAQALLAQHFLYPMTMNGMRSVSRLVDFPAPLDKAAILKPYVDVGALRTLPWWIPGFTDAINKDSGTFDQVIKSKLSVSQWIDQLQHDFTVDSAKYVEAANP
ncbi:MAG TPA: sugar ABC transporter substrate-binding protein, partial [Limnochordia bacterium]|nr:sugar ABC transporter substrate-binding protein [Limnochordia bacterium]